MGEIIIIETHSKHPEMCCLLFRRGRRSKSDKMSSFHGFIAGGRAPRLIVRVNLLYC